MFLKYFLKICNKKTKKKGFLILVCYLKTWIEVLKVEDITIKRFWINFSKYNTQTQGKNVSGEHVHKIPSICNI